MAGRYDLNIDQGGTFIRTFVYKDSAGTPQDLTGFTAGFQIRKTHNAKGVPIFDGTTFPGALTIPNPTDGKILLTLTDEETQAMPAPFEGVWDLEIEETAGDVVTRLLEGKVLIAPNVTRDDL